MYILLVSYFVFLYSLVFATWSFQSDRRWNTACKDEGFGFHWEQPQAKSRLQVVWPFPQQDSVPIGRCSRWFMMHLTVQLPQSAVPPSGLVTCWHRSLAFFASLTSPSCWAIPRPEASAWMLKGKLKFSCVCRHLYLFLMTFQEHLHFPLAASPGSENTPPIWRPMCRTPFGVKGENSMCWILPAYIHSFIISHLLRLRLVNSLCVCVCIPFYF